MSKWIAGSTERKGAVVLATVMLCTSSSIGLAQNALSLNESKTVTVYAKTPFNKSGIKLVAGKRYRFTVGSPEWNNGSRETTANGYNDSNPYKRWDEYRLMELIGEIYNEDGSFTGKHFRIGMGREYTAASTGLLVTAANDCRVVLFYFPETAVPACYVDNSRVVTLTVKRIE
jgi:hypothetical protein